MCLYLHSGKHGVSREACLDLAEYIKNECDHLSFAGLMTIGRMKQQPDSIQPNSDFIVRQSMTLSVLSFGIEITVLSLVRVCVNVLLMFSRHFNSQMALNSVWGCLVTTNMR